MSPGKWRPFCHGLSVYHITYLFTGSLQLALWLDACGIGDGTISWYTRNVGIYGYSDVNLWLSGLLLILYIASTLPDTFGYELQYLYRIYIHVSTTQLWQLHKKPHNSSPSLYDILIDVYVIDLSHCIGSKIYCHIWLVYLDWKLHIESFNRYIRIPTTPIL